MYKSIIKRLLDIILSLTAIIILSPLLIPVMLMLWATGEHYVFYGQNRIGYKNSTFKIWKFATMLKASPSLGSGSITLRNDPRVLPFGGFLRKTKINELPQLFNILLGDMSVVGPRPLMKFDFDKYTSDIQSVIYNTRPGLSGIASLVFCDEEKLHSETSIDPHEFDRLYIAPFKGALEKWYQQHCSFYTDIMIIFLTGVMIISPDSKILYKIFKDLPTLPENLKQ
jgi:lipopolysaccharide/colanic/teichoic acid biosynthesis glycosyltransferase